MSSMEWGPCGLLRATRSARRAVIREKQHAHTRRIPRDRGELRPDAGSQRTRDLLSLVLALRRLYLQLRLHHVAAVPGKYQRHGRDLLREPDTRASRALGHGPEAQKVA